MGDAPGRDPPRPCERGVKLTQLEQLAAQFEPGEHKTRSQGGQQLTYVSIDATIKRLNDVLGPSWGTNAKTTLEKQGDNYLAFTQLTLEATIDGTYKLASGVGAMVNRDPDMAAKTALAEAIKKAGHQLGVGLYLWDPAAREQVAQRQRLAGGNSAALKQEVFKIAKAKLDVEKPTAAQVAKVFDRKVGDLADDATLRAILEEEGVL